MCVLCIQAGGFRVVSGTGSNFSKFIPAASEIEMVLVKQNFIGKVVPLSK